MKLDIKEILSAWKAKVKPTSAQKDLAKQRAEICDKCDKVGKRDVSGQEYCTVCGCYLKAKVYSYKEGACPEGKWDEVDRKYRNTEALKVLKNPKPSKLV